MKVKEEVNLDILLKYGFKEVNKEEEKENEQYTISTFDYKFNIGHGRRGQHYFILIKKTDRELVLYSTESDGDSGCVIIPNFIIELISDSIVE